MSAFLDETGTLITVSSSNPLPTKIADAADGTSPTNPSVLIGAKTPAGLKKTITADSNGCLYTRRMIVDTTGAFWFDPDSCSYTINKNSDGTISTEVYVDPLASKTYTKTYTTTSTQITATGWVAS